jgi:hypothetical protein
MGPFEYHPLSKITVKETLILNLTFEQVGWLGLGLFLTTKMYQLIPPIPLDKMGLSLVLGLEKIIGGFYNLTPLVICIAFAYVKHSSGMSLSQFLMSYISFRRRKKNIKTNYPQE